MIVSWVYPFKGGSKRVHYQNENNGQKKHADAKVVKYKWYNYTSGYIHHCTIKNLEVTQIIITFTVNSIRKPYKTKSSDDACIWQYDTKYYYTLGRGSTRRTFSFVTPPEPGPDVPYTFGLIGKSNIRNFRFGMRFDLKVFFTV